MATEQELIDQLKDALIEQIKDVDICVFCAGVHDMVPELGPWLQPCPRVKKLERTPAGELVAVEFWPSNQPWESRVTFLSDEDEDAVDDAPADTAGA